MRVLYILTVNTVSSAQIVCILEASNYWSQVYSGGMASIRYVYDTLVNPLGCDDRGRERGRETERGDTR